MAAVTTSLIATESAKGIDTSTISKGDLIRAKYTRWTEAHNGIVAQVTASEIRVLYLTEIGNVSNFFVITSSEIENGLWEISWSEDLEAVKTTVEASEEGTGGADADSNS